jgi:exonuclease SbcC
MRPLRLRVEGFGCYREPVEVSFDDLTLFAIEGPTGSGKSTLLDAVVYALYGQVPRLKKNALGDWISLGADRASVLLDLSVGGETLRVVRTTSRRKGGTAQLERLDPTGPVPLAEGVGAVGQALVRRLGLGPEAFLQAVVLPQGEFQAFLRSEPRLRRQMLRELLRLDVYERMRQIAEETQKEHGRRVAALDERIAADFAGLDDAALDAARERVRAAADRREQVVRTADRARDAAARLREAASRWAAVRKLKADLDLHAEQRADVDRRRRDLGAADRAAPLAVRFDAVARAAAARDEASLRRDASIEASNRADLDHDAARAALADLGDVESRVAGLRSDLARLDAARADRAERDAALTELRDAKAAAAAVDVAGAEARVATLDVARSDARTALDRADADVAALPDRSAEADRLTAGLPDATRLGLTREERARAALALATARDRRTRAEAPLLRLRAARDTAEADLADARLVADDARAARGAALRAHAAHDLRAHLTPGAPCPVCLRAVEAVPADAPPDALLAAERAVEVADAALRDAERRAADAGGAFSSSDAERAQHVTAEARAADTLAGLDAALVEAEARLRAAFDAPLADPIEASWVARRQDADAAVRRRRDALDRRDAAARDAERADDAHRAALAALDAARERADGAARRLDAARRRVAALPAASELDPDAGRAAIEAEIGRWTTERDRHREGEADARAARAAAAATRDEATRAADARAAEAAAAEVALAEAARAAGFVDAAAAAAARVDPAVCDAWRERVGAWDRREAELAERRAALGDAASVGEVRDADVSAAEAERDRAEAERAAAEQEVGASRADLDRLDARAARAAEVRAERDAAARERERFAELAADLRSDRFQAALLDDTFRKLVRGASERLFRLSGRYRLDWRDEDFLVIDHDNARERRSAATLSGGETFLASLALALELSEQIQGTAGATRLESLFVDEGFGSLDAETLDVVADAVEALGQEDRMVGLITHVPELTARLPARIEVRRGSGGATARVVR